MPLSGQSPFGWASSFGCASATLPNKMPLAARRRSTRPGAAVRACPHCTVATLSGASAVEKPVTIWLGIAIWLCIESWDAALRDCRSVRTVHHALRRAQTLPARHVSVAHGRGTCDGSRQERHLQPGRQHDRCQARELSRGFDPYDVGMKRDLHCIDKLDVGRFFFTDRPSLA